MAILAKCEVCKREGRYAKSKKSTVCAKCQALKPARDEKGHFKSNK